MNKKLWEEKKTSLGNAIIIGTVLAIIGGVIGANWNNIFSGFAPYLGFSNNGAVSKRIAGMRKKLDEVQNKKF